MEFFNRVNNTIEQLFGGQASDSTVASPPREMEERLRDAHLPPHLDESFVRLGDKYIGLKNYEFAIECYREAIRINPKNTMAFNRLVLMPTHLVYTEKVPDNKMLTLSLTDAFRQTLIGGYIVLSKILNTEKKPRIYKLLEMVQDLDQAYFEGHGTEERNFGILKLEGLSYVWMINSVEHHFDSRLPDFPVLILMRRSEYQKLKLMVQQSRVA